MIPLTLMEQAKKPLMTAAIKKAFLTALCFMLLTFPLLVIRVNTTENIIEWRWKSLLYMGMGSFFLSLLWRYLMERREAGGAVTGKQRPSHGPGMEKVLHDPRFTRPALLFVACFALVFPFLFSTYEVNIMISALTYVVLGLGLNIVVGLAGLLDLGYVAFYAVGAYGYALLNYHFGLGFWTVLPIGAVLGATFGILLGFPVLRLRGDYLAIVTLGFGEIVRLILENWNELSFGPSGIANIPRPGFFGMVMDLRSVTIYLYFIVIAMCLFTMLVVSRLRDSRIGRAWIALREDEVACQAMGIDKTKTKLRAFALGATWAGMGGVIFAARTTFINPASFTFMESAMILAIVVMGGMGSIWGVVLAAFILILLPEYLRAFSEYRMLLFGATMVVAMVFRPQGLISKVHRTYEFKGLEKQR